MMRLLNNHSLLGEFQTATAPRTHNKPCSLRFFSWQRISLVPPLTWLFSTYPYGWYLVRIGVRAKHNHSYKNGFSAHFSCLNWNSAFFWFHLRIIAYICHPTRSKKLYLLTFVVQKVDLIDSTVRGIIMAGRHIAIFWIHLGSNRK